jgi:2OG-Fe(II) oxygenase superfamily
MAELLSFAVSLPQACVQKLFGCTSPNHLHSRPALAKSLERWGLRPDSLNRFALTALNADPPLLCVDEFLSDAECNALVESQRQQSAECDMYLNYRVNSELVETEGAGVSAEAVKLIDAWSLSSDALTAGDRSGFRTRVDPGSDAFQPILEKVKVLLGLERKEAVFAEDAWVRPNRRSFCIRDQTTVYYRLGEGVSPHVDGKDATVLIYLSGEASVSDEAGGATCFPEIGLRIKPKKGTALLYWSKHHLLHYAEKVRVGEKWICQLLVDFRVRNDEPEVDWQTGQIIAK